MTESPKLFAFVLRLLAVIGVVAILYFGKSVLLVLTIAGLIAVLLDPLDNRLRGWGWKPGLSIAACVFLLVLLFAGLFFAVGKQGARFAENWPEIESRLMEQIDKAKANIPMLPGGDQGKDAEAQEEQDASRDRAAAEAQERARGRQEQSGGGGGGSLGGLPIGGDSIQTVLSNTLGALGDFLLMFVYIALFLSQKERLREFVLRRAPDDKRGETHRTINEAADVAQQYLKGRLILIGILSVLYGAGFALVGLDYALVIAVLVAVLSIIPYLGNIVGGGIAVAIAMAGGGGSTVILGVLGTMAVAQLLESYILTPLIVGDEVDINPLTTIVAVVAFSVVWGAVGAIVAIPVVAIVRIIFKHIRGMEDYAYLLGQE